MNNELLDALTILEKEKNISKETLLEAIENSLLTANIIVIRKKQW